RTNVVFVTVRDRENIDIRIWERGAGETAASGTCATGAAVLSSFLLKTSRDVRVHSPGGTTDITWRQDDKIVITGTAKYAFSGEWPL
ncbi:MAG: diaminopimelate epimerase, partial [Pyrinomonadaceae bacterium]